MRLLKKIILSLIVLGLFSCTNTNDNFKIDIIFFKYNVMKELVSPNWDEFIEGRYPEYQAKRTINSRIIYDSLVCHIKKLEPLDAELQPEESYPFMQCTFIDSDKSKSILILHSNYLTLNGEKMVLDTNLVNILKKESGYNNPPTFERK